MPDFKKEWPEMVYKILMAILTIIFGYNQYQNSTEHQKFDNAISELNQYVADPFSHTDYLLEDDE